VTPSKLSSARERPTRLVDPDPDAAAVAQPAGGPDPHPSPGDQPGGSGHLSHTNTHLGGMSIPYALALHDDFLRECIVGWLLAGGGAMREG
jgi:hypothetical protein